MYDQKIKPPQPEQDREIDLDEWDEVVAKKYGVPSALMKAMAKQESGGNVNAKSPTGVVGKYQVTQRVARSYGLDRNDPFQQSVAAARYLRDQYDATKDVADEQERWLASVGKYYAGPGAVKGGEVSGSSVDGVSNPIEHVTRVAKNWGAINKGTTAQPTTANQQPTTPLAPKRTTRTPAASRALTQQQSSPFSLDSPTGFQSAIESVGRRTAQISPEGQEAANLANAEATRFQGLSRTGQALDVAKAGGMRGAQGIGNMMRRVGQLTTGQSGGKPALAPETEAQLQRQEAAQNVALPNTAPVGRGLVSGAIQTVPALAAGTAGLPAAMLVGAGTQAANEDWSRPGRAAARIALNAAIPVGASKLAQGLIRPATALGQVASGTAGGALGNVGAAAAEQAAFDGRLNPQDLAQQAVIGGVMGGITPPPKYQPRQGRLQPATPDQVFRYDADGNEINPQMGNVPESAAVQRIPQAPFDPSIAAPESTLTPAEIRAQYRRPQAKPLQEKLAGPPRETTPLRRTRGIDQTEALAPDAPTTAALAPVDAEAPAAQAPEAPQRTYPVRDSLRAEADAAKIEAATLEQQGRMDEAAIKYDAAHRALTRLRRSLGTPKTPEEASLLTQVDQEISAAAQNRTSARGGPRGRGRTTAPEEVRDTAPTRGLTNPLLNEVTNPEGGVPPIAPEPVDFTKLAARQERGQDNPLANKSILARIRELGGIKPGQDSGELASAKDKRYPGLINRRAGISPDEIIQYLAEDGYPVDRNDLNSLWKAIDDDVAGGNVRPLDRQMSTQEVMGEGYTDFLRAKEDAPGSGPLPKSRPLSAMEQARAELGPEDQALIQRALSGEPAPGRARQGMVSFSPYNDLVTNNKAVIGELSRMNLDSPEARPLIDQLDSFAQRRRIDPEHVENLKNYLRNDQMDRAGLERRGVKPSEALAPEPTANLRKFYSESDTLPEGASGRLSGRLPRPVTKTPETAAKPPEAQRAQRPQAGDRPTPELAYKGDTAPLDMTQPEQMPQMPEIQDLPTKGLSRFAEMSRPEVEQSLADAEAVRNREIRNPQMSAAENQANREIMDAAKARRREFVEQDTQWGKSEFADEAKAFKEDHGRFPKDLAEMRRGRPKTEPIATIQHERFGQVEVIEKAPNGKLVVEDAEGQTHTIKNPRTSGNRGAAFVRRAEGGPQAEAPSTNIEAVRTRVIENWGGPEGLVGEYTIEGIKRVLGLPERAPIDPLLQSGMIRRTENGYEFNSEIQSGFKRAGVKTSRTEELSIPVADQMGKLSESAVAPNKPKIVADAEARLRETATGRRANAGQALFDQAIVTGHSLYKAGMTFKDWSAAVAAKAGEAVQPYLRRAWAEIQKFHRDEGGAAKAGPGPAPRPEPASATARSTRNLAGIRMEDLGTGGAKKRAPRREATPPTPETMKRAGLRDITAAELKTPKDVTDAASKAGDGADAATPDGFFKSLSTFRKAAMLSKPVTHITNMLSNAQFQGFDEVARIPAGIADMAVSAFTKRRTLAGANPAAAARASWEAATEGIKQAKQILKTGLPEADQARFELKELNSKSKIVNVFSNSIFRGLSASDQIFKTYAVTRSIESQAKVMALNEARAGDIKRSQISERTKFYKENPTNDMAAQAVLDAEVATFQNDNLASEIMTGARAKIQERVGDVGGFGIDMFLPFTKTPTNILTRMLEMSPLGYVKNAAQLSNAIIKKTGFTSEQQRSFSTTFGRASIGSGLVMLGYGLAAKGMMTGLPDTDWRERTKDETRAPHAAIYIPGLDRWVSMSKLAPVGTMLAIGATLHRDMNEKLPKSKSRAGKVVGGVGQVILDNPYLRGAKDVSEFITEPDRVPVKLGRMASSFIPAALDDVGTLTDSVQRKASTFGEAVKGRIPGLRQSLKPKTNAAGQPIKTEWTDVVDPFRSRSRTQTGSDLERRMIDLDVGAMAPDQKPGEPENVYRERVDKVQRWFQQYGAELVGDPSFNALTPEQQEKAIQSLRSRVSGQANLVQPSTRGFAASQIIRSIREGERNRDRQRGKFIWTPPED